MTPDGDTAAHLRKQVGGLFFSVTCTQDVEEPCAAPTSGRKPRTVVMQRNNRRKVGTKLSA
jgi:hypothetical protein